MPRFTDKRRSVYLAAVRTGAWRTAAAQAAGIHFSTVRRHMLADPDFAAEVEDAELDANTAVENALYTRALEGHVTACLAWLYSRMPDRWRDMRQSVSATPDPVPPARDLTPQQRERLLQVVEGIRADDHD
jgi:hypothetical protein